jgi:hypothetical protein
MSPKQSIDIDVIGDIDDNMKDLMAGIGQALNEALSSSKEDSSKGMMNDILQQLKNSKRADKIDEDSFINMLNALKKAANDDLQEEE